MPFAPKSICEHIHTISHCLFFLTLPRSHPLLSPSPPPPQLPLSSGPGLVSWSHDWGINRRGRGRVTEGGRGSGSLSLWLGIDSPQWGLSGGIMLSQPLHNLCRCCAGIKCVYVCVRDTEREREENQPFSLVSVLLIFIRRQTTGWCVSEWVCAHTRATEEKNKGKTCAYCAYICLYLNQLTQLLHFSLLGSNKWNQCVCVCVDSCCQPV